MIAFLGMGLLGSNFVRALRQRGEDVHVWNRTTAKARALEATGAHPFDRADDAVRGADRVHIVVADDAAVDSVLGEIAGALEPGVAIVDHSTTLPSLTGERVERWNGRGFNFVHAPVFMGPQNALQATGTMLASGDRARYDRVAYALEPMTGRLIYLGADPTRAALFKLMGNLFLEAMIGGITDMFALAKSRGVPAADAAKMLDWFNPGSFAPGRARKMSEGQFADPSWTLAMARKDARLMMETAAQGGEALSVIPAVVALMDQQIARGNAGHDWTVIAEASVQPTS